VNALAGWPTLMTARPGDAVASAPTTQSATSALDRMATPRADPGWNKPSPSTSRLSATNWGKELLTR